MDISPLESVIEYDGHLDAEEVERHVGFGWADEIPIGFEQIDDHANRRTQGIRLRRGLSRRRLGFSRLVCSAI